MSDILQKLESSIENLKNKSSRIYFFVQDTKGNAKSSIKYTYQMALTLKDAGYNVSMLHEKKDYFGVQDWLGNEYMEKLPHLSVEGQNLQISPEDTIIIPELFGYIMQQIANLPCAKIVLCQSYDYIFETLQPGQTWAQFGFLKCITTSEEMKSYISQAMRGISIDVIPPVISDIFSEQKFPPKPIITIHTREQRDSINIIKAFYVKYPQYRWISFKDMRGISEQDFASALKDSMLSVWIDDISSFGTYPLESMSCGVPVLGKIPKMIPSWLNEENGIWLQDSLKIVDIIADYIQNWLEDNISENLIKNGLETASKFSNEENFKNLILSNFEGYQSTRVEMFQEEINKHQEQNV